MHKQVPAIQPGSGMCYGGRSILQIADPGILAMKEGMTPVVAIGASAGGLEALSDLVNALSTKTPLAYVVVQHLNPDHKSLLTELLAKKTAMPVLQIREGLQVEPAHIYVIPPNTVVRMDESGFRLAPRNSEAVPYHPVDILFVSLANTYADAAIGVVLSGGDSDGTLGVQAIKHSGGISFAQTPESAKFPSMPSHAIETGCVDFVLSPKDIAHEIDRLSSHPYLDPTRSVSVVPTEESTAAREEEEALRRVFRRLRATHGVDFSHYKRSTLRRRLGRRMAVRKANTLSDYARVVDEDAVEAAALYQDFLIRVTGFFRDPDSFESLRVHVFPSLAEGRTAKDPIRIWVPGCATGEEVYSIAIALVEYLGEHASSAGVRIFGTDVSDVAIEEARAGRYPESIAEGISAERLQRFFYKDNGSYHVIKSIRDLCVFARQDVTRDPPFSRLDLVSCRNLLIYLDALTQRRVMHVFHYSLRSGAFLMLGPSESVGVATDLFELLDKQPRIYLRRGVHAGVPVTPERQRQSPAAAPFVSSEGEVSDFQNARPIEREADWLLLSRYSPASLLVDEQLNILQFRGETSRYLEHASGSSSLNLHRVARPELLVEITPAIEEVRSTGAAVRREGLSLDESTDVALEVIPLTGDDVERAYLVVFEDGTRRQTGRRSQASAGLLPESEKERRIAQLERELLSTREYLQTKVERHAAVQEELKSAHEEVLSANEEFQSTNEELETAKEELQSSNEELATTNDELRARNRELAVLNSDVRKARDVSERARGYADAIISSVPVPLLVLDTDLRILRANPSFYTTFDTHREDNEGRFFAVTALKEWSDSDFLSQLHAVLAQDVTLSDYVFQCEAGPGSAPRTLLANAQKIPGDGEREELILLAVEDITERKNNADNLRDESRRKDEFLAMLAHELRNPLTPITHAVHLLREGQDHARSELYALIERQTLRLVRLVDDLLDVARISRGHIEVQREAVDVAEVARNAVETTRPTFELHEQTLSVLLPDEPVWVDGDAVRLEQVISNLLQNAAKYTGMGGTIDLELTQDGARAVLSVRDNGIGLAPENVASIFDLFAQVDRSLAHSEGGLGIGLTLVRRVLELHGGSIEARSTGLGRGTEFIVSLPIGKAKGTLNEPDIATDSRVGPPQKRALRVLIVDDSEDVAESVAMLVRFWGHTVCIARDGASALESVREFDPERAVVDIGLPDMTGYELAPRLREVSSRAALYLVALSGYGTERDRASAFAAGFDAHLTKPANSVDLRRMLEAGNS